MARQKVSDYRKHAEDCKALLAGAKSPEHREMLLNMAATWEALAVAREKKLAKGGLVEEDSRSPRSPAVLITPNAMQLNPLRRAFLLAKSD
jgi:hypothetical protein